MPRQQMPEYEPEPEMTSNDHSDRHAHAGSSSDVPMAIPTTKLLSVRNAQVAKAEPRSQLRGSCRELFAVTAGWGEGEWGARPPL